MKSVKMKNRKMNKRLVSMFIVMAVLLLGGCSLAKEETENESSKDRMIGAFITDKYLDLFDMDAYLNDHALSVSDGEEIVADHSDKYNNCLYATINKRQSKDPADWDISYFVNPVYQTEDGRIYVLSESGGSTSGNTSEGEQFAITISDENTVTGSSNSKTGNIKMGKTTVTVRLSVVYEPVKVTLYQG